MQTTPPRKPFGADWRVLEAMAGNENHVSYYKGRDWGPRTEWTQPSFSYWAPGARKPTRCTATLWRLIHAGYVGMPNYERRAKPFVTNAGKVALAAWQARIANRLEGKGKVAQ